MKEFNKLQNELLDKVILESTGSQQSKLSHRKMLSSQIQPPEIDLEYNQVNVIDVNSSYHVLRQKLESSRKSKNEVLEKYKNKNQSSMRISQIDSINSDAQINPEFLLNILNQYSKDHNALLIEEVSTKLGKAIQQDNEKIKNLADEVSQLKS